MYRVFHIPPDIVLIKKAYILKEVTKFIEPPHNVFSLFIQDVPTDLADGVLLTTNGIIDKLDKGKLCITSTF